jgi:hypothetical protein
MRRRGAKVKTIAIDLEEPCLHNVVSRVKIIDAASAETIILLANGDPIP